MCANVLALFTLRTLNAGNKANCSQCKTEGHRKKKKKYAATTIGNNEKPKIKENENCIRDVNHIWSEMRVVSHFGRSVSVKRDVIQICIYADEWVLAQKAQEKSALCLGFDVTSCDHECMAAVRPVCCCYCGYTKCFRLLPRSRPMKDDFIETDESREDVGIYRSWPFLARIFR